MVEEIEDWDVDDFPDTKNFSELKIPEKREVVCQEVKVAGGKVVYFVYGVTIEQLKTVQRIVNDRTMSKETKLDMLQKLIPETPTDPKGVIHYIHA
jgi:hypothetical protein